MRRLACATFAALVLMVAAPRPALADRIDPLTGAAIVTQLLPRKVESISNVRGTAKVLWYWKDPETDETTLIGWNSDTAGVNLLLPDFGVGEIPVHFPNTLGKGIRMAAWTESGQADFRQDKPGKVRSKDRRKELEEARKFGGADEVPQYGAMVNEGKLWSIVDDMSDWEVGPHLLRCGAVVTGGKERTLEGLILGLAGKSGSYAALDAECYVDVGIVKFTDNNGRIRPEFWDAAKARPRFDLICQICHLVPADALAHLPSAPAATGPMVIIPQTQSSTTPGGTGTTTTQSKDSGSGKEASSRQTPQQPATQPMQQQANGQDAQQNMTEATGTNQWLTVRNCTSVPLEVACERLGGGTTKSVKVLPGNEHEFEIPAGDKPLLRIWVRKLLVGQETLLECVRNPALPATVTGPDRYQYPVPELGHGKRVPISEEGRPVTAPGGSV